ncbi:aspartate aminotransferase family protein [Geomicrobium sp. JSM 1781026]|uniref:aminotransferase family protein n=1 Tax=Geomicrobium sp. JSM 1781026 TaxID=3344580 RepID=UPI0035C21AE7
MAQKAAKDQQKELLKKDQKHFLHPTSNPKQQAKSGASIVLKRGKGIYVEDIEGKRYMDGLSSLWNVHIGHGNEELANVSYEQMSTLAYASSFKGYSNPAAIELSEELANIAPDKLNSVFYTSGGSESNDTAFKLSRFYWEQVGKPEKKKIISLERSYHGVTVGAQSATHLPAFHSFSGSYMNGMFHALPHLTDCERGNTSADHYEQSIRGIVEREGADTVAAVILEPIQGAGGIYVPPAGYLEAVRKLCDEFDIHLIADEVICGFGRTGKMFAVEHWDVTPDFLSVAKGITSGYAQLGGVLIHDTIQKEIANFDGVLAHGFTYSGHPTACAVGLKNIEIIEREGLVERADEMGKVLADRLEQIVTAHSTVGLTRGMGLLRSIELFKDSKSFERFDPNENAAERVYQACFDRGLLLRTSGGNGVNIIPMAPPLIITEPEIDELIDRLDAGLTAFESSL